MNDTERNLFWNVFLNAKDNSPESLAKLNEAYSLPKTLCRFRSVNESSLLQLQDNVLYFSSADYYDDPFDTYFYIDYKRISKQLNELYEFINVNPDEAIKMLRLVFPSEPPDKLLEVLKESTFSHNELKKQLTKVRDLVHQQQYSICFCENPLNESLWLKYADNHRGFVLMYDPLDENTFNENNNKCFTSCNLMKESHPNIFPVYYTDKKYDATKYALGLLILNFMPDERKRQLPLLLDYIRYSIQWDSERISLTKKECHKYDEEWRMLYPCHPLERPSIYMKPSCIALGLRMPEYKRRMVISAAQTAGISQIKEIYINDFDELGMRNID